MTETSIPRLTFKLAIPATISTMITMIYNMADTWFVAKLGTSATAAIGVTFSISTFMNAIGFLFGMGSGTFISRLLGAKKNDEANRVMSTAFFSTMVLGVIFTIVSLSFIEPLMLFLGASHTILPYAVDYGKYILLGFPIMCTSLVLSTILRCEGRTDLSMLGIASGGVLNIFLDPLFIFVFKMGISGAAIATLTSQLTGFIILLSFYFTGKSVTKLHIKNVTLKASVYKNILTTGTPSLCRHAIGTIANISLNVAAGPFGDAAIAAMAIVGKVVSFAVSISGGIGQGAQTIFAYNKGAGRFDRVRATYRFALTTNTLLMVAAAAVVYILAPDIAHGFQKDDPLVVEIASEAMRLQSMFMVLIPFNMLANMLLQSVGESAKSSLLASLRQGFFYVPLLFILPIFFKRTGIMLAQPMADVLTFCVALPVILWYMKKLREMEKQNE